MSDDLVLSTRESILASFNNITSTCMRKRIIREITDVFESTEETNIHIEPIQYDEKGLPIITMIDFNQSIYICQFNIPDGYPFRCPKIKVNYMDYNLFLQIRTPAFLRLLRDLTGLNCLCCNSYLCGEKWTPAIRLIHIVREIKIMGLYKRDIINKYFADKIKERYLIDDIDLDSWLGTTGIKKY